MVRVALFLASILAGRAASQHWTKCGTEKECNEMCGAGKNCQKYDPEIQSCTGCVQYSCFPGQQRYKDPVTGKLDCCPKGTEFEFDNNVKQGDCCDKETEYLSVNKPAKAAGCCPKGETPKHTLFVDSATGDAHCCEETAVAYTNGKCVMPDPKPDPDPNPDPTPKKKCGKEVCPPNENDLGIEYGKCYMLKSPQGTTLSLKTNDYRLEPTDQSDFWQFRVCHDTNDCSEGGTVSANDEFVLNDVIGKINDSSEGPWWVCRGGHYKPCTDPEDVKKFMGRKWCTSEGCGICLKGGNVKGIRRTCPGNEALGDDRNPRLCMPFVFEEVTCLADNPAPADDSASQE